MFPLSHRGRFRWTEMVDTDDRGFKKRFLSNVSRELKRFNAKKIKGNRVSFHGGIYHLVSNVDPLAQIDYGYVEVKDSGDALLISYFISFKHSFIIVSALVGLLICVLQAQPMSVAGKLTVSVVAWAWLLGMTWLIAVIRFSAFVRRLARETHVESGVHETGMGRAFS